MLSEAAKEYRFTEGEYKNCAPSEMLNHYIMIQHMNYMLGCSWVDQHDKFVYRELIDHAKKLYDWVNYITKNEKTTL